MLYYQCQSGHDLFVPMLYYQCQSGHDLFVPMLYYQCQFGHDLSVYNQCQFQHDLSQSVQMLYYQCQSGHDLSIPVPNLYLSCKEVIQDTSRYQLNVFWVLGYTVSLIDLITSFAWFCTKVVKLRQLRQVWRSYLQT